MNLTSPNVFENVSLTFARAWKSILALHFTNGVLLYSGQQGGPTPQFLPEKPNQGDDPSDPDIDGSLPLTDLVSRGDLSEALPIWMHYHVGGEQRTDLHSIGGDVEGFRNGGWNNGLRRMEGTLISSGVPQAQGFAANESVKSAMGELMDLIGIEKDVKDQTGDAQ